YPNALADPADENVILLEQQNGYQLSQNSPFMLVVPGAPDGSQCKLMAPSGVGYADFSPDGSALAWLIEPPDDKATLWRCGPGATAARRARSAPTTSTASTTGARGGRTSWAAASSSSRWAAIWSGST